MPIITERLEANIYLESWEGVILPEHLGESTKLRNQFLKVDGENQYCVLIDLSKTATLPKPRALKEGASIHPANTQFVIFGLQSPWWDTIAGLVRMAGFKIWTVPTLDEAVTKARELLGRTDEAQS
jgi:hypothetical protein